MNKIQIRFSDAVAVLLVLLAADGLIVAHSSFSLLSQPDALFPLKCRGVLVCWAVFELLMSAWLFAARRRQVKLASIAGITLAVLLYRIALAWKSAPNFSDCLGNLYDWFPISPRTLGLGVNVLLACALIASCVFVILNWQMSRQSRRQSRAVGTPEARDVSDIKFNCTNPACGQHVVVAVSEAGRFIRCPSCDMTLQIPGAPPAPVTSPATAPAGEQRVPLAPEKTKEEPVLLSPVKRWLCGWGVALAVVCFLTGALAVQQQFVLPKDFEAMADELFAAGEFRAGPFVNDEDTRLVYARNAKEGGGIYLADPRSQQSTLLTVQNDGFSMDFSDLNMIAWAPGGGLLALPDKVAVPDESQPQLGHHLNIFDVSTASLQQSLDLPERPQEMVWLTTNSLVVLGRSGTFYRVKLESPTASIAPVGGRSGMPLAIAALQKSDITDLTRVSDHSLAYISGNNVLAFDLTSGATRQVAHLTGSVLRELDYDPGTGEYLFDINDQRHRHALYSVNPDGTNINPTAVMQRNTGKSGAAQVPITQVSNSRWVLGGQGVAYLKTQSLFVVAKDETLSTNLFADGYVQGFGVSPRQNKLYAFASQGKEPPGIWEYDLNTRTLRNVIPGVEKPFSRAQTIGMEDSRVDGPGGKSKAYYKFVPPAHLDPGKKYPALIRAHEANYWTPEAQLVANSGIFYVLVSDGSTVSNVDNLSADAKKMLTTYYAVLNNPNVDPHRIYILAASRFTFYLSEVLDYNPSFWRGAFLESPVRFPDIQANPSAYSSLAVVNGGDDNPERGVETARFIAAVYARGIPFRLRTDPGAGHILTGSDLMKNRYKFVVKYILEDY